MRLTKLTGVTTLAILLTSCQAARAELLALFEGDKENGPNPSVALDSSEKGAHGIFQGDAGLVEAGRTGGALNFSGNQSNMFVNSASMTRGALQPITENQSFTVGFWMAGGDSNPKDSSVFWADGPTPDGGDRAFQSHATWSNSEIYLDIGGCCSGTQRLNGVLEEEFIKASVGDEWTHLAYTLAPSSGDARIYVNGEIYDNGQGFFAERFGPTDPIPVINNFFVASSNSNGNFWEGRMDDFFITDNALSEAEVQDVFQNGARSFFNVTGEPADYVPLVLVADNTLGTLNLSGELTDVVKSEPQLTEGLTQFWYDANMRANPEAFLEAGDTGTASYPLVADPFVSDTTWWAGSQNQDTISDMPLERYPAGLAGTRFEGSGDADNYGVRLTGEIFFEENGDFLLRDGIDDFTMIAVDQDGNGELDELDTVLNVDVGQAPFGDVLVLDDDWANLDGSDQLVEFHGLADVENIPAGGDWRQIEIWMSEEGGGDGGILYMGSFDDPDIFDDLDGGALSQEERDQFVIRNDQLRTTISVVESANANASLDTGVEYVVQLGADAGDRIAVEDNEGVYTTTLDVTGATIRVEAAEGIAEGTAWTILDADNLVGVDELTILFDDPTQWDLTSIASGIITFGAGGCNPNSMGDIDGDGTVAFSDFLVLSANFGSSVADHTSGDIDCDGTVAFADFLVLSANFGNVVGQAVAAHVPEPSGFALLAMAALAAGLARRRRCQPI